MNNRKQTTDQYYSIINIPPKFLTTIFDLISFWFFVRSWVSISYLRDFMQNTNNFQADTTLFRTSDNLFEIKTHYTLKQKLLQNETFFNDIQTLKKTLNWDKWGTYESQYRKVECKNHATSTHIAARLGSRRKDKVRAPSYEKRAWKMWNSTAAFSIWKTSFTLVCNFQFIWKRVLK